MQPNLPPPAPFRRLNPQAAVEMVTFLVVLAVTASARFPLVPGPTGRDSGTYAYTGWAILNGQVPYRDLWVNKPPGILYLDALGLWLAGGRFGGILCLEFAVVSALLLAQWVLVAGAMGRPAAAIGALFTAVWLSHPDYLQTENLSETYTALCGGLAFSMVMGAGRVRRTAPMLAAGVVLGAAFMFKPSAGAAAAACGALCLLANRESLRRSLRRLGALVAGWCLVVLGVGAYFAWESALSDFWDVNFAYIHTYLATPIWDPLTTAVPRLIRLSEHLHWAIGIAVGMVLWAAGHTLFQWRSRSPLRPLADATIAAGIWLALSLILVAAPGRYYGHYFLDVVPPLGLLVTVAVRLALELCPEHRRTAAVTVVFAAVLATCALQFEQHHRPRMRARLRPRYAHVPALIAYLEDRVWRPGGFFIWGADASVYLALRSPCPSRFIIFYPFLDPDYATSRGLVAELLSELERAAPEIIVDASPHAYYQSIAIRPPDRIDARAALQRRALQPFFDWVAVHYEPVSDPPRYGPQNTEIAVYRRADSALLFRAG